MSQITRFTLLIATALVLTACSLFGPPPGILASLPVRLTVQTRNAVNTFSQVGDEFNYEYIVTNTGNSPLAGPVIIMDTPRLADCPNVDSVGNRDAYLDVNETIICTAPYTITDADLITGSVTNLATATVGGVVSNSSSLTLVRAQPSSGLTLSSTVSSQTYSQLGETITYTYVITNPGQNPLGPTQFTISDNKLDVPFNCGPPDATIAPGQSLICSASYLITQADLNSPNLISAATASGAGETSSPATTTVTNLMFGPIAPSPVTATSLPELSSFDMEEAALQNLPTASYEYLVPRTLLLNERFTVKLRMSRSLTESQLATHIVTAEALATSTSEAGTLVSPEGQAVTLGGGRVEVTPLMRAALISEDAQAFEVRPIHDNPVQVLNPNRSAEWQWLITAKKGGTQNLIFVISQQAKTDDEAHWHLMETERRIVTVNVTMGQQLRSLDWKWITGILLTLLGIPSFWHWLGRGKNERGQMKKNRRSGRANSLGLGRDSLLSKLPLFSKSMIPGSENPGHIFISYRRSDSADITGRIYDSLVDEFGTEPIFKDVDSIPLGTDFKEYLAKQVSECKVLLAIIGDRWVDARGIGGKKRLDDPADFVRVEIEFALERGIPVIPLLVRGAQMPDQEDLPPSLRKLVYKNGIPIRPDPDFHRDMDRLIAALAEHMGR